MSFNKNLAPEIKFDDDGRPTFYDNATVSFMAVAIKTQWVLMDNVWQCYLRSNSSVFGPVYTTYDSKCPSEHERLNALNLAFAYDDRCQKRGRHAVGDFDLVVTLSTAHMTEEDDKYIQQDYEVSDFPLTVEYKDQGWFIYVGWGDGDLEDILETLNNSGDFSEGFVSAIEFGCRIGAKWLVFDADGQKIKSAHLPTYDW